MTMIIGHRTPGPVPQLVRRKWEDAASDLQAYLQNLLHTGEGLPAAHTLLSSSHSDTLVGGAIRGALLVGNSSPLWTRLVLGASGTFLRSDGSDPLWALIAFTDLPLAARGWTDDGVIVRLTDPTDSVSIGQTAPILISGLVPRLTVYDAASGVGQLLHRENATGPGAGAELMFLRRRSGWNVLSNNDTLGMIEFTGADGTQPVVGAMIKADVDAAPGANDMPGRLSFLTTPDGSAVPLQRMMIDRQGFVGIGNFFAPETILHLMGDASTMFTADQYNTGAGGPQFLFRKARGTRGGGETQVVANDRIGAINGSGWTSGGTFGGVAAGIRLTALESFTSTAQGTAVQLMTNAIGGTTLAQRARADGVGLISGAGAPHSRLQAEGPLALAYTSTAVDLTLDNTHSTVAVDTTGGNRIITLPTAVGITGRIYTIKRITGGANTLTVDGNGAQTIDGALTVLLPNQWDVLRVQSDSANWLSV